MGTQRRETQNHITTPREPAPARVLERRLIACHSAEPFDARTACSDRPFADRHRRLPCAAGEWASGVECGRCLRYLRRWRAVGRDFDPSATVDDSSATGGRVERLPRIPPAAVDNDATNCAVSMCSDSAHRQSRWM